MRQMSERLKIRQLRFLFATKFGKGKNGNGNSGPARNIEATLRKVQQQRHKVRMTFEGQMVSGATVNRPVLTCIGRVVRADRAGATGGPYGA